MTEKEKVLSIINKDNKNILDVGCGDGRYAEFFTDTCNKYVGIDLDIEQINKNISNNSYNNAFYECSNIIDYKNEDRFDYIILSLAFHEIDIKEQGLALKNMLNLLREDGKIIILDPALDDYSFQGLWNVAYNNLLFFNHDYMVKHSKEVIDNTCKNNLCKIVKNDKISPKFKFGSINELLDMILESDEFKLISGNTEIREILRDKIIEFLENENDIILEDKLDITVLEKVVN